MHSDAQYEAIFGFEFSQLRKVDLGEVFGHAWCTWLYILYYVMELYKELWRVKKCTEVPWT